MHITQWVHSVHSAQCTVDIAAPCVVPQERRASLQWHHFYGMGEGASYQAESQIDLWKAAPHTTLNAQCSVHH